LRSNNLIESNLIISKNRNNSNQGNEIKRYQPETTPKSVPNIEAVAPQTGEHPGKFSGIHSSSGHLVDWAILVVLAGGFGYNWAFCKAIVVYTLQLSNVAM